MRVACLNTCRMTIVYIKAYGLRVGKPFSTATIERHDSSLCRVYSTICLYTYSHPLSFTSFLNLEQSGWSQSRLAGNVKKGKLLFPDTVYTVALAAYKEGTVNTEIERECEHKRDPRCRTNIDK